MTEALIEKVRSWWAVWRPKNISKSLSVDWDDTIVTVRVLDNLDTDWNQEFKWSDITRVCFKDEGIPASDILFLEIRGQDQPATVLTEARRGTEFFAELVKRGFFPDGVLQKAITSSTGGLYCWPPNEG
jgi:hypothetical protein